MIAKIQKLVEQMSMELPHILAVAVVSVEDGMSIAEVTRKDDIDTAAASAYLSSIVKSNSKAINLLAGDQVIDDILITTNDYHFIIRHMVDMPFFIFLMTTKEEWLAKARGIIKQYEPQLVSYRDVLEEMV